LSCQESGSALPGAGQQGRFAAELRHPGLDIRCDLAYCYAYWGLLAREQHDRNTEREKLAAALVIFTDLKMRRQRDAVRAELEKTTGG
jgi:hypothetical protein